MLPPSNSCPDHGLGNNVGGRAKFSSLFAGAQYLEVGFVLCATGEPLVANQRLSADEAHPGSFQVGVHAISPSLIERHTRDRGEEIDAVRRHSSWITR